MKNNNDQNKRYVPYGCNGEYFVYDTKFSHYAIGFSSKGSTKKHIQLTCDRLNKEEENNNPNH